VSSRRSLNSVLFGIMELASVPVSPPLGAWSRSMGRRALCNQESQSRAPPDGTAASLVYAVANAADLPSGNVVLRCWPISTTSGAEPEGLDSNVR
jgi:hypothetical protein